MTVSQLHAPAILGPDDLAARPVAVIAGTRTVFLAEERGMQPVPVESLGEAVALLKGGKVDAVVHDTPLLRHYLKNNPDAGLALAPQTFESFTYGITYPKGSPWRERLDLLLVKTLDDGTYEKIHTRWFGVRELHITQFRKNGLVLQDPLTSYRQTKDPASSAGIQKP
jgi:ABC-type amino acid transport substrate-binding protein